MLNGRCFQKRHDGRTVIPYFFEKFLLSVYLHDRVTSNEWVSPDQNTLLAFFSSYGTVMVQVTLQQRAANNDHWLDKWNNQFAGNFGVSIQNTDGRTADFLQCLVSRVLLAVISKCNSQSIALAVRYGETRRLPDFVIQR